MSFELGNIYAPSPVTQRGKALHIGGDFKEQRRVVYACDRNVILRDINNPLDVFVYNEHQSQVNCARLSPSGYYVASSDNHGQIRVWDPVGEDHVTILEKESLPEINDMAWSPDSKRIVAVGRGSNAMGDAFFSDSGASVGIIDGHSRPILSCDFKQSRPYRVATGSEDMKANWYQGPPFKFNKTLNPNGVKYVNCVRFSPDGSKLATAGQDKNIVFYEGKTGEKISEISGAHKGSIYSLAWSPDSTRILTSSADKTAKIWDAESGELVSEFVFSSDAQDMQLGCQWVGETLLSINLRGDITILDPENVSGPRKVIHGHNKRITSLAASPETGKFYTSDYSGHVIEWDAETGETNVFDGIQHSSSVVGSTVNNGQLITVALDDSYKSNDIESFQFGDSKPTPGQPRGVHADGDIVVVITHEAISIIQGGNANNINVSYEPKSVLVSEEKGVVVVGGSDNLIHVLGIDGSEIKTISGHNGSVDALAFSPDATQLAAGDSNREIKLWNFESGEAIVDGRWVFHDARINCVAFSPDGTQIASGALDSHVYIWNIASPGSRIKIQQAHYGGVSGIAWLNPETVVSTGNDCTTKTWIINSH
eukprot:TRINITY_DN11168_c0_g1_i1.p1 TRINITY_DN11168_c0_g1~~TRINITY_DN11168_c0_g1_i1.p1  ORF type:complete len:596 (-),score=182.14 TRINITY_DN11168_c0_g1_i1:23-1810(-)